MKATPCHVYWCAKHGADYATIFKDKVLLRFCAQCVAEAAESAGKLEMPNPSSNDQLLRNRHTRLRRERRILC